MNLRHAAALGLVGWYLMTPPLQAEKCWKVPNDGLAAILNCEAKIDSQAPLRKWTRVPDTQEFEYKTDCMRAISNDCHWETDGVPGFEGELCNAECIATDDPRLKGK
jgi:hypothetical protein